MTSTIEIADLSNLTSRVRQLAREVDAHYAAGSGAAMQLGQCLFEVWDILAKQDQTCSENTLIDRVEQWVSDLDLNPDECFVPGREHLRAIINRVAEGYECSLAFLRGD